jgi:hypothetical protein
VSEPESDRPVFYPIDVATVTRMSAPQYGVIARYEQNSQYVLLGEGDKLLVGPLGINYHIEGTDRDYVYLRRWDQPSVKDHGSTTLVICLRGPRVIRTYKGQQASPAPPDPKREHCHPG